MNVLKKALADAGFAVTAGEGLDARDIKELEGRAYFKGIAQASFYSMLHTDVDGLLATIFGITAKAEEGTDAAADEQARLAAEQAEQDRLAAEQAEQDRRAAEQAEQDRLAAEQAEQARLAEEQAAQERQAAEQAAAEKDAAEQGADETPEEQKE